MSDSEQGESSNVHLLSTEFKDSQLEIVEVSTFDKSHQLEGLEGHVLESASDNSGDGLKYMQVLDPSKNMMVDLLNLTLVRTEDGQESYRLVTNGLPSSPESNEGDATVTCVVQNEEGDAEQENPETYVMVEGADGPLMFLQQAQMKKPQVLKTALTSAEILERAKALQKPKKHLSSINILGGGKRGRKRRGELPPPHELLALPTFKLFLYSCKMCSFRCNAIKELTAHKVAEHGGSAGSKGRGGWRSSSITLQCARCPFRGCTHSQLMRHVQEKHVVESGIEEESNKVYLDTAEVEAADVLVCGACGFESSSRAVFKKHIEEEHGATTC